MQVLHARQMGREVKGKEEKAARWLR